MDKKLTGFTNIQKLDPDIIVDLKYATEDNFTEKVIYDFTTAIARTGTAYKLAKASEIVKKQGYRLKVWDAYRPKFVAEPNPNFSHQKGVTFDLTLTDKLGNEVEMQTGFDDFSEMAARKAPRTPEQEKNYKILNDAMLEAGFVGYENEWWDYRDSQMDEYEPLDADPNEYKLK